MNTFKGWLSRCFIYWKCNCGLGGGGELTVKESCSSKQVTKYEECVIQNNENLHFLTFNTWPLNQSSATLNRAALDMGWLGAQWFPPHSLAHSLFKTVVGSSGTTRKNQDQRQARHNSYSIRVTTTRRNLLNRREIMLAPASKSPAPSRAAHSASIGWLPDGFWQLKIKRHHGHIVNKCEPWLQWAWRPLGVYQHSHNRPFSSCLFSFQQ